MKFTMTYPELGCVLNLVSFPPFHLQQVPTNSFYTSRFPSENNFTTGNETKVY